MARPGTNSGPTPKTASGYYSTAGMAAKYPKLDVGNPNQLRLAATNITNLYHATPNDVRQAGMQWYDKVHEATAKGVRRRGMDVRQGAGIVAAVSPNMDWERRNIDAFHELTSLKQSHWDAIQRSAQAGRRTGEAASALKGLSISTAQDAALVKAHRIMQGEDVDSVLNRRTAPKTNSFAHNIAYPDRPGPVTIDGRAHDIAMNSMQPWTYTGRGISSAALPSGKKTRYEHFEDAYRTAGSAEGILGHQIQAVVWEGGKHIERSAPTKSGRPRVKGVSRTGQGYLG